MEPLRQTPPFCHRSLNIDGDTKHESLSTAPVNETERPMTDEELDQLLEDSFKDISVNEKKGATPITHTFQLPVPETNNQFQDRLMMMHFKMGFEKALEMVHQSPEECRHGIRIILNIASSMVSEQENLPLVAPLSSLLGKDLGADDKIFQVTNIKAFEQKYEAQQSCSQEEVMSLVEGGILKEITTTEASSLSMTFSQEPSDILKKKLTSMLQIIDIPTEYHDALLKRDDLDVEFCIALLLFFSQHRDLSEKLITFLECNEKEIVSGSLWNMDIAQNKKLLRDIFLFDELQQMSTEMTQHLVKHYGL
jgi:hypothetical protein